MQSDYLKSKQNIYRSKDFKIDVNHFYIFKRYRIKDYKQLKNRIECGINDCKLL